MNVRDNLCIYDPRQSDYYPDLAEYAPPAGAACYCCACFSGRSRLANEVIKMQDAVRDIIAVYPNGINRDLDGAISAARELV